MKITGATNYDNGGEVSERIRPTVKQKLEARIAELEADNAKLMAAITPFASAADVCSYSEYDDCLYYFDVDFEPFGDALRVKHLRAAKAALDTVKVGKD